jgi:hypothetical protein
MARSLIGCAVLVLLTAACGDDADAEVEPADSMDAGNEERDDSSTKADAGTSREQDAAAVSDAGGDRDASSARDAGDEPEANATKDAGAPAPDKSSAIAVLTRTCGPDDCLSYLSIYESVDAMKKVGKIDKTKSVEVSYSQGRTYDGSIYLFSRGEAPEVTRWSVEQDLSVSKKETVSFANTGTLVFCEICNVFANNELAFHLDSLGEVIVSWNPTTMEIIERTDVPKSVVMRIPDATSEILWPRVFDNRAFYTAAWFNYDTADVYPKTALLTFDATDPTPEITAIEDDRCGGSWAMAPFADEGGNVYMMGEWYAGRFQAGILEPQTKPACLLRVKPGADVFDPDYYVDLLSTLDAQAVRGAWAMADGHLLVNILPNSAPKLTKEEIMMEPEAYGMLDTFEYVVLNLETLEAKKVSSLGSAPAGSATPLTIDNRTFIQRYDADYNGTIFEVRTDGTSEKILEAGSGDFDMIGRVR